MVLFVFDLHWGMIFGMDFGFKEDLVVLDWLRALHRRLGYSGPLFLLKKPFGLTQFLQISCQEA